MLELYGGPRSVGPSRCTERGGVDQYWTILSLTLFNPIKHQQSITQLCIVHRDFTCKPNLGKTTKCFSYIV